MYGEAVKNLEISKFTLLNNKPLINIIDKPKLPLKVNRQSIIFSFILSSILGGFFNFFLFDFNLCFERRTFFKELLLLFQALSFSEALLTK